MQEAQSTATTSSNTARLVNGLDPEAIATAAGAIATNPEAAKMSFRAVTSWRGGLRSRTEIAGYELGGQSIARRHTIEADEPSEMLGDDTAPNPQDLLLAALNACMSVGFVVGATMRGVTVEALAIESALTLDLRGAFGVTPGIPPGTDCIHYTIRVKCDASPEVLEEIHKEVIANSPNRFHVANPIRLTSEIVRV